MSIYLVDGSHLLHRISFTPMGALTTSDGKPSGVVHGFLQSLITIRKKTKNASKFIVCWDKSGSVFRTKLCPTYKGSRYTDLSDEDREHRAKYNEGRTLVQEMLGSFCIPSISIHGVEADDIIAYLSKMDLGDRKVIFSDDSDLTMLVNDSTDCYKGMKKKYITKEIYAKEQDLDPEKYFEQMVDILAITGTHNDVIGIKGLGFKTAHQIVKKK